MTETITAPLLGLDEEFSDRVYVLSHPASGKYGCYCHNSVHGLACFSSEMTAFRFVEHIELSGMISEEVSFDEAREIAKARPLPVVSLMLLDSIAEPKIHYVR